MNKKKRKDLAFETFYDRYRAAEVYTKVMKVLESCKTCDQARSSYHWGMEVLSGLFKRVSDYLDDKYGYFSTVSIECGTYAEIRVSAMQDDLEVKYKQKKTELGDEDL